MVVQNNVKDFRKMGFGVALYAYIVEVGCMLGGLWYVLGGSARLSAFKFTQTLGMTVINVTLYSTICLMHRSEELSFPPLWYDAAVVVTTICYIRFPSIKMPSGTVKTAGEYDTEFVYLSPSSIPHFCLLPLCTCLCVRVQLPV